MSAMRSPTRGSRVPGAAVVAIACFTASVEAQPVSTVRSDQSCMECRLSVSKVAVLGSASDPVSPTQFQVGAARDSRGRYYVAPLADLSMIGVYDTLGQLERTIGRRGAGPGEYGFIMRAEVSRGDSLLVLDVMNSRLTVLSPTYTAVRSIPMRGRYTRAFRLLGDSILVHGEVRTPAAAGFPLHVIAPNGDIIRSFGSLSPELRRDRPQRHLRHVALTEEGAWTARLDEYRLELWSLTGTLVRSVLREADWFKAWDYSQPHVWNSPPRPMTVDIWSDSGHVLWTMVRVPSSSWRSPARERVGREQPMPPFHVVDSNTDTIIEAIETKSGRLIASQRFSQFFFAQSEGGLLYSLRETDDGDLRVEVWQLRLSRQPGG